MSELKKKLSVNGGPKNYIVTAEHRDSKRQIIILDGGTKTLAEVYMENFNRNLSKLPIQKRIYKDAVLKEV